MTLVYWEINGIFTCLRLRLVVFFWEHLRYYPPVTYPLPAGTFEGDVPFFSQRIQDMLLYFPWRGPNINESGNQKQKLIATMMRPISTAPPKNPALDLDLPRLSTLKKMPRIPHESTHQPSTVNPLPPVATNGSEHPGWLQLRGWL